MSDASTARDQYEQYRFCYDNGHQQWIARASRAFAFWNGQQWDPYTKARLEREGRPALTFNIIESLVRSMKGIQRALRNDVRFMPMQDATAESARIKDAIWLHTQSTNDFDNLETDVYEKGLILERAYYDIRLDYDESMRGDIKVRQRRSQDVVLDPAAEVYDPDEWPRVFTRRWVSYNDILLQYGKAAADSIGLARLPSWYDYEDVFMAQQMGQLPYYNYANVMGLNLTGLRGHLLLEHQYAEVKRKECFIDVATGDFSEIPEDWDRNRISKVLQSVDGLSTIKRNVRTIRWTVTCEDKVLFDADSPYKHFTVVPFFPTFVDGVTQGAVGPLIDSQELYNKITSQELHIINTTANSGWKVKTGSLKNMTTEELEEVGARTGFVAELDDVDHMEKITPNSIPQGHDRISSKADSIMRSIAGVSNQSRGFAREDVAGEAILANQAAQDINFAGWLGNLHRSKRLVARNVLDCAQANYTETRTLLINRGSTLQPRIDNVTINQPTPEGMMLNDVTRGKYTTTLVPAPSRSTMSEEEFGLLLKLRELGIAIPDTMLIELSPAVNKAQIIEAIGGGPDSNDRQRQAEELAAQQQQIDAENARAAAVKQQASAQLDMARAEKAQIEARTDPEAAYKQVEFARIEADREATHLKHATDNRKLDIDERRVDHEVSHDNKSLALDVAKLDSDHENKDADREARREESRMARRGDKKPGAQKSK
jgi:hypothetical protein